MKDQQPSKPKKKSLAKLVPKNTQNSRSLSNELSRHGPKVPVACFVCRRRKIRCDGRRPSCTFCAANSSQCHYAAAQGLTRTQHLHRENSRLQDSVDKLSSVVDNLRAGQKSMYVVLKALACQSDNDAAGILARLRIGQSLKQIVQLVVKESMDTDTVDDSKDGVPNFDSFPEVEDGSHPSVLSQRQHEVKAESQSFEDFDAGLTKLSHTYDSPFSLKHPPSSLSSEESWASSQITYVEPTQEPAAFGMTAQPELESLQTNYQCLS